MSLYKLIKEKILFCIRNKMSDARETLIDIFNEINKKSEQRKRKLSDREIKAIIKAYINTQRQKLKKLCPNSSMKYITEKMTIESNISTAEIALGGFVNGKREVPKISPVGSNPTPPAKKGLKH